MSKKKGTERKMITINSVPESWGFADSFQGASLYDGYNYFCGSKFLQYEQGYKKGKALFDSICWDDGKGSHKLGYSLPRERTVQRTERVESLLKPYEVDGWVARRHDVNNYHNRDTSGYVNVTFIRFVDVTEDK